jgi:sialate O-acetylesterase
MSYFIRVIGGALVLLVMCLPAIAQLRVHGSFGENMVLQRDKPLKVWGWAKNGETVRVSFGSQSKDATSDGKGNWSVTLEAMEASAAPQVLTVQGAANSVTISNVLVGDVWLAGGQSNMETELRSIYHGDVEIPSAQHPEIRLMTIPATLSRRPQTDITANNEYSGWTNQIKDKGYWVPCSPETVKRFCGIGYLFARRLYLVNRVPIGIVDMSVGGSTVEAWTSAETLKTIPGLKAAFAQRQEHLDRRGKNFEAQKDLDDRTRHWERESAARERLNLPSLAKPTGLHTEPALDQSEPSLRFNAMTAPLSGMALKGIIWNQGWNNAGRDCSPTVYRKAFFGMIGDWRKVFGDPELPFGIIAFTSGGGPQTEDNLEPQMLHGAPWIREAQFAAYKELNSIGFTAAYDQQMTFYHTFNKKLLAERIARWALATQYGLNIGHKPAMLIAHEIKADVIELVFDREVIQLYENRRPIVGMAIAGEDRHFYPAKVSFAVKGQDKHERDIFDFTRLLVSNELVAKPVAVRYAWAQNPLGNLGNRAHNERMIPVPTFRTDDWSIPFGPESGAPDRNAFNTLLQEAETQVKTRKKLEAELLYTQTREE